MPPATLQPTLAALFSDAPSATKAVAELDQLLGSSDQLSLLIHEATAANELSVGEHAEAGPQGPLGVGALRLASELQPATALSPGSHLMVAGPLALLIERASSGTTLELSEALQRCGVANDVAGRVEVALREGGILVCAQLDPHLARADFYDAVAGCSIDIELRGQPTEPEPIGDPSSSDASNAGAAAPGAVALSAASLLNDPAAGPAPEPRVGADQAELVGAIPPGESDAEVQSLPEP